MEENKQNEYSSNSEKNYHSNYSPSKNAVEKVKTEKELKLIKINSYINGYSDGKFLPNHNITRTEASTIFARILSKNNIVDIDSPVFNDIESSSWAFYDIIEAANSRY